MSTERDLHPDFGPSYGDGPNYGIPVTTVAGDHPKVRVHFDYASESDQVRYPLGPDTRIEGGRDSGGDMHAIVVDSAACKLYETWTTRVRQQPLDGRLRRRLVADAATSCAPTAGPPPTPPDCRSCPGCCGGTRCSDGQRRPRHPVHHRRHQQRTTCGRPATTPARRARWAYPPMGARFRLESAFSTAGFGANARRRHQGDEDLRPRPRRQRLPVVLPGRAERALADRARSRTSSASRPRPSWPWTPRRCMVDPDSAPGPLIPIPAGPGSPAVRFHRLAGHDWEALRAVAQLGSALDWGSRGRRFKSCQPDRSMQVRRCFRGLVGGCTTALEQGPLAACTSGHSPGPGDPGG